MGNEQNGMTIKLHFRANEMVWIFNDHKLIHVPIHQIDTKTQNDSSYTEWCHFLIKKSVRKRGKDVIEDVDVKVPDDWVFRSLDDIIDGIKKAVSEIESQEKEKTEE